MPKEDKTPTPKSKKKLILLPLGIFLLILASLSVSFYLFFLNRIYPNIYIAGVNIGTLTKDQAKQKLQNTLSERVNNPLSFTYQNQKYQINLSSYPSSSDLDKEINLAFSYGHTKFFLPPLYLSLPLSSNAELTNQISTIEQTINKPSIDAQLSVNGQEIVVTPSQDGQVLDEDILNQELGNYLNSSTIPPEKLPTKIEHPNLSYQDALNIKQTLDKIKLSPLQLVYPNSGASSSNTQTPTLDLPTLLSLIDLSNSQSSLAQTTILGHKVSVTSLNYSDKNLSDTKITLDPAKTSAYLQTLAQQINQPVKEPLFSYNPKTNKVTQFQPPQEGKSLDINSTYSLLSQRLISGNLSPITLPIITTPTKNQLTNQLGIKELLGEGVSHFYHSIPNRIYNLELAASRVNGTLVAPGDTFSFDQTVGDISGASGYRPGYIISGGRTVLDDGGGVCQDSTTLFRAVLNAGLPVLARTAHAYRVGYYEQGFPPGLDATVFAPSVDFKFKNDTPGYILIQARADDSTETLYYDLYGTSDGRVSNISTPVILSQTPPLPDVHQPDPTLPKGTIKQVDFSAWGANVVFHRTVTRNGQTLINETYHSNYQPWANVYLDGTG